MANLKKYQVLVTFMFCGFGLFISDSAIALSEKVYVRGDIGLAIPNKVDSDQQFYKDSGNAKFKSTTMFSAGLGYKINNKLRTDLSYNYLNLKYSVSNKPSPKNPNATPKYKQDIKVQAIMASLFYDISTYQNMTPFLGLGIGYSNINPKDGSMTTKAAEIIFESKKSQNLTYAFMAGVAFNINKNLDVDFGYRYQDFGKNKGFYTMRIGDAKVKLDDMQRFRIKNNIVTIGVRYTF